jgi:uncharacterized protein (DUF2235 family)
MTCHDSLCLSSYMIAYRNFKKTIFEAYKWLSEHYRDGDHVYLFGAFASIV